MRRREAAEIECRKGTSANTMAANDQAGLDRVQGQHWPREILGMDEEEIASIKGGTENFSKENDHAVFPRFCGSKSSPLPAFIRRIAAAARASQRGLSDTPMGATAHAEFEMLCVVKADMRGMAAAAIGLKQRAILIATVGDRPRNVCNILLVRCRYCTNSRRRKRLH